MFPTNALPVGFVVPIPTSPWNVAIPATRKLLVLVIPITSVWPRRAEAPWTSRNRIGIEVPIPTKPVELTMKLSLSTWTPFLKLNDLL